MRELPETAARFIFRLQRDDQVRFYLKLASLLEMKRPLIEALNMLWLNASDDGKKPTRLLCQAIRTWRRNLERGHPLSEAMAGWIPERDHLLLAAGERSGNVDQVLLHMLAIEDLLLMIKKALTQAVGYVTFLLLSMLVLLLVIDQQMVTPFKTIAPQLVAQSGLANIAASAQFFKSYGLILIVAFGLLVNLIIWSLSHWTGQLRTWADFIPPWSWYRFWQGTSAMLALSSMLSVNIPLRDALETLEKKSSPWLKHKLQTVLQHLLRGQNLGEALMGHGLNFPDKELAMDLKIFAMRGDIGTFLGTLVRKWIPLQVKKLERQAALLRTLGLILIGFLLIEIATSIYSLYDTVDALGSKIF